MKITVDMVQQAKRVDFVNFLSTVEGLSFKQRGKYFTCIEHDSLNLVIGKDGLIYYTWHSQQQRGDIIEYVETNILGRRDFIEAVKYLLKFEGNLCTSENKKNVRQTPKVTHSTGEVEIIYNQDAKRTFAYLCKSRGISYKTVALFTKEGLIAQDIKGNVVFKHRDFNNNVVGAELKGTNTIKRFAGTAKGSNEAFGFSYSMGKPRIIYIFEAEIDLLSFYDLYGYLLKDCMLLSTSGANKYMKIATYIDKYDIDKIIFCMDNDNTGNQILNSVKGRYKDFKIIDGRRKLIEYQVKDFNELLLIN